MIAASPIRPACLLLVLALLGPGVARGQGPVPIGSWTKLGTLTDPGPLVRSESLLGAAAAPRPRHPENFWVVSTRPCPQVMGVDPWPCLRAFQVAEGGTLVGRDPADMLAGATGHPVLVVVGGNMVPSEVAVFSGLWTHAWLDAFGALPPEALVVLLDWPCDRVRHLGYADVAEKDRRALVTGFQLARIVSAFPPGGRVCLLGQSLGGRIILSALHLLGGGGLDDNDEGPTVRLPVLRPDLRLRGVAIASANDHDWFNPCEEFDRALPASEGILNLYNRRDAVLVAYPTLPFGAQRRALGRVGLRPRDARRIGPWLARYEEHDLGPILGPRHSLQAPVAHPRVAGWIAPYAWAAAP